MHIFRIKNSARALALLAWGSAAISILCVFEVAIAQAPPPDRTTTFSQDSDAQQAAEKARVQKVTTGAGLASPGVDFRAPSIEFDRTKNEVVGKGGVIISEAGVQIQADQGSFNTTTREGNVEGHVVVSSGSGVFVADRARLLVPNETGDFTKLEFEVEDGGYLVNADKARKVSEFDFELEDSSFTTCHCADGSRPWEINSESCSLTQEGYAHLRDSTLWFEGLPVFYSPYLVVPVKNERASGILPPQWGLSDQDGFMYRQPILGILDHSSDFTISPFIATHSRWGGDLGYEQIFSTTSTLSAGALYSDESWRGDSLRGLNVDDVYDPTIDKNRYGGYYKQNWSPDPKLKLPVEFVADGRYTSDNLMLRELPAPNIGAKQSQFLVSTAVLRGTAFEVVNAEARAEYNQMLLTDQDVQVQRLPEALLSTGKTLRPWGFNPYGLKLVTNASALATDFVRQDGYDGWRYDLRPRATVPFHLSNVVRGQFGAELHQTQYNMNETKLPGMGSDPTPTPLPDGSYELEDSISRTLPIFSYGMNTGVERAFGVDRDGLLSKYVNLGAGNERRELLRVKHSIEPGVDYTYIPDVDQENNPLYDQLDRFRARSLVGYGITQHFYGKFQEPIERLRSVEELSASDRTLPMVDLGSSLLDFGRTMAVSPIQNVDPREGEIREIAMMRLRQTYDLNAADASSSDSDSTQEVRALSDLNMGLVLSPSGYFSTGFEANYGTESGEFSSYSLSAGFMDDREDVLRSRYTFVDSSINQLEMNLELALHTRIRLGGYVRYDAEGNELIESRGLLRFINSCKCWSADLGYSETVNPDRSTVLFTFTFGGLGSIKQGVGLPQDQ